MGVCCICGDLINHKELQKNAFMRIGDYSNGKFHSEATLYYHLRCLSKVIKKEIVLNN